MASDGQGMQNVGHKRNAYRFLGGRPKERDHLEGLVNGRIILRWILRKRDEREGIGYSCFRKRTNSGLL